MPGYLGSSGAWALMPATRCGRSKRVFHSGLIVAVVGLASVGWNTDLSAPPRYDGAGYAVLGMALAEGRGYREIESPDPARHTHYPPGYPLTLAAVWRIAGRSVQSAHILSVACTVAAILAAWWWFRSMYTERVALAAGLALAANWTWGRVGGAIQSEPSYFLWAQLAILAATWAGRRDNPGRGVMLGALLAASLLTRHVGVVLVPAIGLDLLRRRRWSSLGAAGLSAAALTLPWIAWSAASRRPTQLDLLVGDHLATLVARQLVFYAQRIPDQLIGPVVEIGTVFANSTPLFVLVNTWAVAATGLVAWGWSRALRSPRRRLAGLIPMATLPLLWIWPFTEAGRFLIPLAPCLIIGAIEGLTALATRTRLARPRAWAAWAVLAASLPYPIYSVVAGRAEVRRRADRPFDAACDWIVRRGGRPGPVLSGHPAEVFWITGRVGLGPGSDDPRELASSIDSFGVAYLVVDERRYAGSPVSPLGDYVRRHPERVSRVWSQEAGGTTVSIFEVRPIPSSAP
jgi:hypothetical protein